MTGILEPLVGHDGAKAIIRGALKSSDVHCSLRGPPGSGKSVVLTQIDEAVDGAKYADGAGFTEAKLRDALKQNPPFLLIDEFDGMENNAYKALNTALEQGRVTKDVVGESYDVEIDTQVFVALNYDDKVPGDIEDRFLPVEFEPYDRTEFIEVCERILPKQVEWLTEPRDARRIGKLIWDQTGFRSFRMARDATKVAGEPERVPSILTALDNPQASVESEPVTADELQTDEQVAGTPVGNPIPFDEWVLDACPHMPADRDDNRRYNGHYLCESCVTEYGAEPTTPFSSLEN